MDWTTDDFIVTDEDRAMAEVLVRDGWLSTSNRYHTIKRVALPPFDSWVTFDPAVPNWLRQEIQGCYESQRHPGAARSAPGEERTLTPSQFKAFKQAGGSAA